MTDSAAATTTALEEAYERAATLVDGLRSDQLGAPTPCAGWDVRATLNHALGAAWMFTLANEGRSAGEDAGDLVGDDPSAALAEAAAANLASWRRAGAYDGERSFPFGTFPATAAAMINLSEVIVHTWDIAVALGVDAKIDPSVGQMLYEFYSHAPLDGPRAHGAFGAEVELPPDADGSDHLLALLGRRPR
jgi:uncharacterized protein (TIGR03086 family)